jgi:hypothetical protein
MMKDRSGSIRRFEEIIDREVERHPHNQPLLEAFGK